MNRLLTAIRFLTVVPLPSADDETAEDFARSVVMFPVVGLLIGGASAVFACGVSLVLPPLPAAVVLVAWLLVVSGGLHMDGLSDTADGFFSSRPREQILEIMKDSRVGAMGVIAIVLVVLLKTAALASLPTSLSLKAAFLAPACGRCVLVLGTNWLPNARTEGGLASLFCTDCSWGQVLSATAVAFGAGWCVLQYAGLIVISVDLLTIFVFLVHCYRKIGGVTGDTLGASCELAEVTILLAIAARPLQTLT